MINTHTLEALSPEELEAWKKAINNRLDQYIPSEEGRVNFENRLKALEVLVDACDPLNTESFQIKALDRQLADLEREVAYSGDYELAIRRVYNKIQKLLPRWKRWFNKFRGGRQRFYIGLHLIIRKKTRSKAFLKIARHSLPSGKNS